MVLNVRSNHFLTQLVNKFNQQIFTELKYVQIFFA